ncbi:MAG TPA: TonB-dependent receptor, partial [Flavobacteriales bacterium]|nr:TonB-dependent receptor [Flavobacteriales bacterium]
KTSEQTDENGVFVFTDLKPGTYTVLAAAAGFTKGSKEVTLKAGDIANIKLFISPSKDNAADSTVLEGVDILWEGTVKKTQTRVSVIRATPKDIKSVPTIGGESDIATYFQTVPGVITTGDQGGQLYVRGGAPIQNKVMLDGMVVYNPFHSIGFFSVFDTDIIKTADIYTGGYNSEYGGRISSVMDITTRDGNRQEMDGKISVSPFGAKLLLEGPIGSKKKRGPEGAQLSYLVSAKTSYLAQSSKILYTYIDSAGLPFNYTDIYAKISASTGSGSKFSAFGFNYIDSVTYQTISKLKWNTLGGGANFVLLLPGSPILTEGHFAYSKYGITLDDKTSTPRLSDITGFNGGFDFKYFQKRNEIKYGIEVIGYTTNYEFTNAASLKIQQREATTELAGYLSYKIIAGRLIIEPGFRAHYYASLQNFSPEPRLSAKFNFNENFRMKLASGIYSQNLISANSDRDVVNLFYGFLSGSANLPSTYTTGPEGTEVQRSHDLQKAMHAVYGFEYDLNTKLSFNLEGYFKRFSQLTNINRNKIYDADDADKPDYLKLDYIIETGNAYGVDFVAKYSAKKTYLWFTYSLGKVTRWDGIQEYAPVWDRRHNINIVFTQKLDKKENWEVNARWNFGSGLPFTKTAGVYAKPVQANISGDPTATNPTDISYAFGTLNGGRLPTYHRFDITIKRKFEFYKMVKAAVEGLPDVRKMRSRLEINAGATNVYNRANVFYVERSTNEVINQLPIIPTIGANFEF